MKSISIVPQNKKRIVRAEHRRNDDKQNEGASKVVKTGGTPHLQGSPKTQSRNHNQNKDNNESITVNLTSVNTFKTDKQDNYVTKES